MNATDIAEPSQTVRVLPSWISPSMPARDIVVGSMLAPIGVTLTARSPNDEIVRVATLVHHALPRFGSGPSPTIAIAGLNPHAGEGGALGDEPEHFQFTRA